MNQLFSAPVQPLDSDERYTPRWVFDGLGLKFTMDPCSPPDDLGFVPATIKLTKWDDGLATPWLGSVWCNPPFSSATAWADKFIAHGKGIFLGPVANSRWAGDMLEASHLTWFCRDFAFVHPTHAGRHSSMPLMFCAIGGDEVAALLSLARSGVHDGVLMVVAE